MNATHTSSQSPRRLGGALIIAASLAAAGCQATTYALARNGGYSQVAACEHGGVRVGPTIELLPAAASGCRDATVTGNAPGATYALWQLPGDTEWSGPTPSNVVGMPLVTDAADSGGEGALSDSQGASTLANSGPEPVPPGGHATSPFSIRKSASRESVRAGETVEFNVSVVNLSQTRVERLVLVDRLDAWFALDDAGTAHAYPGPQGTTVLVWDETTGLLAGEQRSFRFRVRARSRAEHATAVQSSPAPSDAPSSARSEAPSAPPSGAPAETPSAAPAQNTGLPSAPSQ
jgi:uncharacterized repeat protein (TIGR01451 family)